MWGHFIELSMRSTLAYLRSMDTGTPLFETRPFPFPLPIPGPSRRHPSFSSGPIVPSSLALPPSPLPPVNVPNVAAYLLSICLSVPLFLTVSRQCSPADKVKHPRRNKLSRPWHFAQLMSTGHAINPPPNALINPCPSSFSVCACVCVFSYLADFHYLSMPPLLFSKTNVFFLLRYFSLTNDDDWSTD